MKHWYASYYNHIAQETQTHFIKAKDEADAKRIMLALMKLYGGDSYDLSSIETINELSEDYFYDLESITKKYEHFDKLDYLNKIMSTRIVDTDDIADIKNRIDEIDSILSSPEAIKLSENERRSLKNEKRDLQYYF